MRTLSIITDPNFSTTEAISTSVPYLSHSKLVDNSLNVPFSNAKRLLGQEFTFAIYDMRTEQGICLHLEALAIIAGTIQEDGTLYVICPHWHNLTTTPDIDSLRWNNQQLIATPHFYHYFQDLVKLFNFEVRVSKFNLDLKNNSDNVTVIDKSLTKDQQIIYDNLPLDPATVHLITAPRGRGKSTLAGKLAQYLSTNNNVIITARSRSVLPNFWKGIENDNIQFYAPDKLIELIEYEQVSQNTWLFIDEAASLPIPMLAKLCHYFAKVMLTTTTQNYEGTGRGFSLKLLSQLNQRYRHWQLTEPLRWGENDPLERFINQLLLLDDDLYFIDKLMPSHHDAYKEKLPFYSLLAQAHYKTTPTDLRRLFDGSAQTFYQIKEENQLIAGCWLVNEGGLDQDLAEAIWRGERRPQGNLVAQYLCFQANLPEACTLHSVRISRIAVDPIYQNQGYGKRLVQQVISQISPNIDFISVSFGMSQALLNFWQDCGFELIQITPTPEASSGYHSAMMIYPLSEKGKLLQRTARLQFKRDYPIVTDLPIVKNCDTYTLTTADWQNIKGFATANRTLIACYASLKRLYWYYPKGFSLFRELINYTPKKLIKFNKLILLELRRQVSLVILQYKK
ncbi:GNAT family N-acetyltransferase [Otariodibacter oris]|uniref:tRNA(Met) cytidine acetyltransferase TmcA n=1 Tax=Otariodibacter oris TaxID=1032623 RepID=A0A420XI89_9PAST|nr:GNAT family N-acetyltransferase [Otariodibacter oris]QGM80768.1 tRNA cytosine(34) acetyltransferase TmcA [Otariodibacter oris]RKR77065.1 tRNA(Met)-cytidine N(4)-acetyltransferase [Otariodibacter oris]